MKKAIFAVCILLALVLVITFIGIGQGPDGGWLPRFAQGTGSGSASTAQAAVRDASGKPADAPKPPPDPERVAKNRVARLAGLVTMTDAQKEQATTIFTSTVRAAQPLQANMRAARTALQDAVKANDTARIDEQAQIIGTLTAQLTAINSKGDAQFLRILTADQVANLPPGALFMRPGANTDAKPAGGQPAAATPTGSRPTK